MTWPMKLSIAGVAFPCIASVIQSFTPLWVFLTFILAGMLSTGIGLCVQQRKAKLQTIMWETEKALGKPKK